MPQMLINGTQELGHIKGFGQIIGKARGAAFFDMMRHGAGGERDDRYIAAFRNTSQDSEHFKAIHARQIDIQ